jgi:acetyl esterase/lipase
MKILFVLLGTAIALMTAGAAANEPIMVLPLWPGIAPGDKETLPQEADTTKTNDNLVANKRLIRLGNVSKPTISIYQPTAVKPSGSAVVVCPGGAYQILAMDLEGTEVCEWLNTIGVTAVLLKYRVPSRSGLEKHTAALQDAQRAIGMVRQHAGDWGIDKQKIGILGFSAGGHLAAAASNRWKFRSYSRIDAADGLSCRPDFAVLIYPAYLTLKDKDDRIAPELTISSNTPPTFIAMAQDDPVRVENALFYSTALNTHHVPFELHIYPSGGHGYGLRPSQDVVTTWPARAADWMRSHGWAAER